MTDPSATAEPAATTADRDRTAPPTAPTAADEALLADGRARALALQGAIERVVVGQREAISLINTAVHARGHVLLAGDVGVGKTTLLRAFARGIGGRYARIEGTVDLMPGDLLYHTYIGADGRPAVDPGPLVQHGGDLAIFFFNEINRARPQVHALLLRAMAEHSVSAFNRDVALPHLLVFADRNRVEREETFEISAAARDRFMMEISIDAPTGDAERTALIFDPRFHDTDALTARIDDGIVDHRALPALAALVQRSVAATPALQDYALRLWQATAAPGSVGVVVDGIDADDLVVGGASPRGMGMLLRAARTRAWLQGRLHLLPEDIRAVFVACMAHRFALTPVHEMRRQDIVAPLAQQLLARVPAP